MAHRKSGRRPKTNTGARRQSRGRSKRQVWGELPFVPASASKGGKSLESATDDRTNYSHVIDDIANLTRRNVAATFTLGVAAGLFTARLARQWTTNMRKGERI